MDKWESCVRGKTVTPIKVRLKDPANFPHQKQLLHPQVKRGLKPIIKGLFKQGILKGCVSPYSSFIMCIKKGPDKWRMVQDLGLTKKVVVMLRPVVPNPYFPN